MQTMTAAKLARLRTIFEADVPLRTFSSGRNVSAGRLFDAELPWRPSDDVKLDAFFARCARLGFDLVVTERRRSRLSIGFAGHDVHGERA